MRLGPIPSRAAARDRSQDHGWIERGGLVEPRAGSNFGADRFEQIEPGREDGHAARLALRDMVIAIDLGIGEQTGGRHRLDLGDAADHRDRLGRHRCGLAEHRGAGTCAQQVGAEIGEELVELGAARGRYADNRDHCRDADGDAKGREDDAKRARAQAIGGEPHDIDRQKLCRFGHGHGAPRLPSSTNWPSRIDACRSKRAARSRS